ncbi:ABC transporter substrate-binding protein [Pelagibacterium xiamenense]|uniref:ABC transporter substrate-binding protein n=1 Tax=Pelagibacterium xiamenense TaxID=2901140 RepID=UPI001E3E230C|nr:ABC transporter substrate-binding protein [Pelagibacterium xiamenense]MCD7058677.1 ABC transporter substrate-binding protein [Pelagibacterium xiamenense]
MHFLIKHILAVAFVAFALTAPAVADDTRIFVDDMGHEVEIPVAPQRIVSMRGEQFAAPLIEMGANIVGSTGRTDPLLNDGKPYIRGAYHALDYRFGDDGIVWVGSPNEHDFEAVAAVEPDLIILPDFSAESYDKLALIAPTVVINIWGQSMLERYRKIANIAGTLDEYERLLARYNERLERARATIADAIGDPASVSVAVAHGAEDGLRVYRDYGTLSQVLRDLGFSMPAIIAEQEEANSTLSPELIEEIDADFIIDTYFPAFDQTVSSVTADWDAMLPNWRDLLHAGRHNQFFMIHRDEMRAVTFQSLRTTLDIVVANIASRPFVPLGADK